MADRVLQRQLSTTVGLLVGGIILLHGLSHGERVPTRRPLRELPRELGYWTGEERPLEPRIVKVVGVDDYLSRVYTDGSGHSITLYIGYYSSQQTGDTIHSPKNCLPGAGWEPAQSRRRAIPVGNGAPILVNEYLVEKGLDRQLVLYWYQARGRVVASEYWGKVWMVVDAITRNRTDGALVRIVTSTRDGEAEARAVKFVQALYPHLNKFIPQ